MKKCYNIIKIFLIIIFFIVPFFSFAQTNTNISEYIDPGDVTVSSTAQESPLIKEEVPEIIKEEENNTTNESESTKGSELNSAPPAQSNDAELEKNDNIGNVRSPIDVVSKNDLSSLEIRMAKLELMNIILTGAVVLILLINGYILFKFRK